MKKDLEIIYPGKLESEEILKSDVANQNLIVDKKFERSAASDEWCNIIFQGDNLQFLRLIYANEDQSIKDKVKGKIKLIYIDPPFGTGMEYKGNKGQNGYSAKSKGAEFIEYIRQRVIVAREILSDDGFIFVRQAYNYGHYIKVMMDEVFGIENFRNEIIISRKRQSMGTDGKFEVQNESLYVYGKSPEAKLKTIYQKRPLVNFKWTGFLKQEVRNPRERKFFGKTLIPPDGQHFSLIQEKVDKLLNEHYLRLRCKSCRAIYYYDEDESHADFYSKKRNREKFKYLDLTSDDKIFGITKIDKCINCNSDNFLVEYLPSDDLKINNIWLDIPSYTSGSGYPSENSEELLRRVIECSTEEGDIVMDFFGGSGTTMIMAEKLNRRWIYCDFGKLALSVFLRRLLSINEKQINSFLLLKDSSIITPEDEQKKYSQNLPPKIDACLFAIGDEVKLKVRSFISDENNSSGDNNKISLMLIDKTYSGENFKIEKIIDDFNRNENEISLGNLDEFGEKAAIKFYDIHGNEVTQIHKIL